MLTMQTRKMGLLAAVAAVSIPVAAHATGFYYAGYDASVPIAGTPDLPVSGPFVVSDQVTFYSDAAGTIPNAVGTGFVTATNISAELVLGGSAAATAYTATTPTSSSSSIPIRSIILLANNPGTNTLKFGFTGSGRYSLATGGTGTVMTVGTGTPTVIGAGIYQGGSTNWVFASDTDASAPLRIQNSVSISGPGSGSITIPKNLANSSGTPSLSVNLPGGGTVILQGTNGFGGGDYTASTPAFSNFTLTAGAVDFQNGSAFGNARNRINLNGGTLYSSTGTTLSTSYTGPGAAGGAQGIVIGGNLTFAGSQNWSLGPSNVHLSGNRVITANTGGTTGATIPGIIAETGGTGFGPTVTGTGTLTLTGANTYTGTTTLASGKLVLGTAAQAPVLTGAGGADVQGGQLVMNYSGTSNADTIRGVLQTGYNDAVTPGVLDSGKIRASNATATRGLGYKDDGVGATTIKPALFGDADLDGGVSINDFNALAGSFGSASGKFWVDGDFDYDGGVSINDFNLLAGGFGQSLPATSESWAGLLAFAAAHNDLEAFTTITGVPEPTSLGLVAAGATVGLRRRRR